MHLLVLPLKVLVAGNDPLFSKETRGEIDVDSQVNHLAGNILYFFIFLYFPAGNKPLGEPPNGNIPSPGIQKHTCVHTNVYTGIHKSVKKYTQMCTQKGSKEYKCIHKYLHKYTQSVEKYT